MEEEKKFEPFTPEWVKREMEEALEERERTALERERVAIEKEQELLKANSAYVDTLLEKLEINLAENIRTRITRGDKYVSCCLPGKKPEVDKAIVNMLNRKSRGSPLKWWWGDYDKMILGSIDKIPPSKSKRD